MKSSKHVLILQEDSFGVPDAIDTFRAFGYQVFLFAHPASLTFQDASFDDALTASIEKNQIDFIFSFNYYPNISLCCNRMNIKYLAYVYDSPHIRLYTYTIIYPCNYIFIFDYTMYEELHSAGIPTVYHLPLAVNTSRLLPLIQKQKRPFYPADVSFVGALYNEKHTLYDRLYQKLETVSPYAQGYLDSLVLAQSKIYGYFFLEEGLSDDILSLLYQAYPYEPPTESTASQRYVYAHYFLARKVTELERLSLLGRISEQYRLTLYTHNKVPQLPKATCRKSIDYYQTMPLVFHDSKINLNITLKSICSGIPLRALDIMGAGGFLLSNYQSELCEFFVPDEDFVFFSDPDDMLEKIDFYLTHEAKRKEIAHHAQEKVKHEYSYEVAFEKLLVIADIL